MITVQFSLPERRAGSPPSVAGVSEEQAESQVVASRCHLGALQARQSCVAPGPGTGITLLYPSGFQTGSELAGGTGWQCRFGGWGGRGAVGCRRRREPGARCSRPRTEGAGLLRR